MPHELAVVAEDRSVSAVQRIFKGECPEHGEVFGDYKIGNHSTVIESRHKRYFTKPKRARLKAILPKKEHKFFSAFIHGNYIPTKGELNRWRILAIEPVVSDISSWLGVSR